MMGSFSGMDQLILCLTLQSAHMQFDKVVRPKPDLPDCCDRINFVCAGVEVLVCYLLFCSAQSENLCILEIALRILGIPRLRTILARSRDCTIHLRDLEIAQL